jgi:hypothetical protein
MQLLAAPQTKAMVPAVRADTGDAKGTYVVIAFLLSYPWMPPTIGHPTRLAAGSPLCTLFG